MGHSCNVPWKRCVMCNLDLPFARSSCHFDTLSSGQDRTGQAATESCRLTTNGTPPDCEPISETKARMTPLVNYRIGGVWSEWMAE